MEGVSVQKQKRREEGRERESKQTPFFLEDKNQLFVISPPRKAAHLESNLPNHTHKFPAGQ